MNPQDIDKTANAVVNSFTGTGPGLLGCEAVSNPHFYTATIALCEAGYLCGGLAPFACTNSFTCADGFGCHPAAPFNDRICTS